MPLSGRKSCASAYAFGLTCAPDWFAAPRAASSTAGRRIVSVIAETSLVQARFGARQRPARERSRRGSKFDEDAPVSRRWSRIAAALHDSCTAHSRVSPALTPPRTVVSRAIVGQPHRAPRDRRRLLRGDR